MAEKPTTPAPVSASSLSACACSLFRVLDETKVTEDDPDNYVEYTTKCAGGKTKSTFLPGHDAKLKSLLIRAGVSGWSVRQDKGGGVDHVSSAEVFAKSYGFETQVLAGIERGKQKLADKAKPKPARKTASAPAKKAATKPAEPTSSLADVVASEEAKHTAEQAAKVKAQQAHAEWADDGQLGAQSAREAREKDLVKAKVGRWEYLGFVHEKSGAFHYTDNSSNKKIAKAGKFTLVEGDNK